jgi:hypothetical protein
LLSFDTSLKAAPWHHMELTTMNLRAAPLHMSTASSGVRGRAAPGRSREPIRSPAELLHGFAASRPKRHPATPTP